MKILLPIFCSILLSYCIYLHLQQKKNLRIGKVNMDEYVYAYEGMKAATAAYGKKMEGWNKTADSLKQVLEDLYRQIQLDSVQHNKSKQEQDMMRFQQLGMSYQQYKQNTSEKAQQEDTQITSGIITQLQAYIKDYAGEKGYDLILSNGQEKSVAFIKEEADLTKEMIQYANDRFNNRK